jgi:hypothetical protein
MFLLNSPSLCHAAPSRRARSIAVWARIANGSATAICSGPLAGSLRMSSLLQAPHTPPPDTAPGSGEGCAVEGFDFSDLLPGHCGAARLSASDLSVNDTISLTIVHDLLETPPAAAPRLSPIHRPFRATRPLPAVRAPCAVVRQSRAPRPATPIGSHSLA